MLCKENGVLVRGWLFGHVFEGRLKPDFWSIKPRQKIERPNRGVEKVRERRGTIQTVYNNTNKTLIQTWLTNNQFRFFLLIIMQSIFQDNGVCVCVCVKKTGVSAETNTDVAFPTEVIIHEGTRDQFRSFSPLPVYRRSGRFYALTGRFHASAQNAS